VEDNPVVQLMKKDTTFTWKYANEATHVICYLWHSVAHINCLCDRLGCDNYVVTASYVSDMYLTCYVSNEPRFGSYECSGVLYENWQPRLFRCLNPERLDFIWSCPNSPLTRLIPLR
jgi:hypothetical protein